MNQQRKRRRNLPGRRRGAIMIVALICLVLVSALLGSLLKTAVAQRKQLRHEAEHLQAAWLAESGVARAASRLATDRGYEGETWKIPAQELSGRFSAEVRISVRKQEAAPDRRVVAVEAICPADAIQSSKQSRQVTVDIPGQPYAAKVVKRHVGVPASAGLPPKQNFREQR